ncbi:MAG: YkgJ family cysteine cluster protein [Pseudomonadales bacterium]|jgi:Fe-S-cluster containining protein|nr:YkgJ family cysteine cluster protein [Pseudomonadales bacterium]
MARTIQSKYQDPADLLWLQAAAALGMKVVRSADAYAAWDGRGTLTLASDEHLDPDDCLAQMIFHELCHLLVSGEAARELPDWGLDNTSAKDLVYEYATNRLQAALAQAYGLRRFMAVTTVWRQYYDALPPDPLAPGTDDAIALAREGLARARRAPYADILHHALSATAALAAAVRTWAPATSLWRHTLGEHPSGFRLHPEPTRRCGDCAWALVRRQGTLECRQTQPGCQAAVYRLDTNHAPQRPPRFAATQAACERYEPPLTQDDCLRCGACCHRGFDVVEVAPHERFARRHPELIELRSPERYVVPRPQGQCVALSGTGSTQAPFLCRHYPERPRSCRDFALGGAACLIARQRCGVFKTQAYQDSGDIQSAAVD